MRLPHPRKFTFAAIIGAFLPFLVGADSAAAGGEPTSLLLVQLLIAALSPPVTLALGLALKALSAGLIARGREKLANKALGDDSSGAFDIAAGEALASTAGR